MSRRSGALAALLALTLIAAACGDDDDSASDAATDTTAAEGTEATDSTAAPADGATTTTAPAETTTTAAPETTTTAAPEPLRILVTNDDGYAAPGIDALVEALLELPDVEITVVAPDTNQSGSGSQTTDGELVGTEVTLASGYPATSVVGFPGDSVVWALANLPERPDIVLSGINSGQNIGPFAALSGTVGAGRIAAEAGIPAVAFSQGLGADEFFDFANGVEDAIAFFTDHLDELRAAAEAGTVPNLLWNVNMPTCDTGEVRGIAEVPLALTTNDRDVVTVDCGSTVEEFVDDIDAFVNGYTAAAEIDVPETFEAITAASAG